MALFSRDFSRPGPGVPKNAPRKKGISRFIEILGRDFSNLVKLNLLYQLCILIPQLLLVLAFIPVFVEGGGVVLIFGFAALLFSIPVGPATTAMYYVITKMMRDDPGFVWHDFKKIFKENFKSTLVPGLLYSLLLGAQAFAVVYYFMLGGQVSWIVVALYILAFLVFSMITPYFFIQAGYLDLKASGLLKNSILLAMGYLPRSFMGALLGTGLLVVQIMFLPLSVPIMAIIGYTIPSLMCVMWVWKPIDRSFQIEKTLVERAGGEWIDPDPPPPPLPDDDDDDEPQPQRRIQMEYEDYMDDDLEGNVPSDDDKADDAG